MRWLARLSVLVGLAFLGGGTILFSLGVSAYGEVKQGLADERIVAQDPAVLLTFNGARVPVDENKKPLFDVEKVLIDTSEEAKFEAEVIEVHSLTTTEGKRFSEIEKSDPKYDAKRETYRWGMAHRTALMLVVVAFGLAQVVMVIGGLTAAIGVSLLLFVTPALYSAGRSKIS